MSGAMQQYVDVIAKDRTVQELNANVSRVFTSLISNPLLSTINIVNGLNFIANTDLLVNHKLNKKVTGFIVINSNAPAIIFQSSTINATPTSSIILKSNLNAIVDILFF